MGKNIENVEKWIIKEKKNRRLKTKELASQFFKERDAVNPSFNE